MGSYKVILKVFTEFNCIDTISKNIIINGYNIFIPNSFTPNQNEDDINTEFRPIGYGINEYQLKIYNRWGENVFKTNNLDIGWDGSYHNSGVNCPT